VAIITLMLLLIGLFEFLYHTTGLTSFVSSYKSDAQTMDKNIIDFTGYIRGKMAADNPPIESNKVDFRVKPQRNINFFL
jgi:hypothetical protein